MEIQYFGANCIKITSKKTNIVIDDDIKALGGSDVAKGNDVRLYTSRPETPIEAEGMVVDGPGEYEISDISITGVAARAHIDEEGKTNATIYKIVADDLRVAITGHIYPDLTEQQLEDIGVVDVLIVPVGGHGFTLDPIGAQKILKEIEPKIVIPTQYADNKLTYQVPALKLEDAIKELALEVKETVPKLKLKAADLLSDKTQLIVLEKQ